MRRLKLILGTTAAVVALVGLPVVALAGIATTAHDFSSQGWSGGEICVVCHTPHQANSTVSAPLWDHTVTGVTDFTMYADSGTLDATDLDQPGEVSLLCLSCHDGTVAVDSFGDTPTSTYTLASTDSGYVGQDLSDDHPIGFTYDTALRNADLGLHDPATTDAAITLKPGNIDVALLFGATNDQMECASCHDPHDAATVTSFLRKENSSSALCLTCHNK
jgi:predicted CXXCH cytochrome family protein